jgi:hypothetical protein
VSVPPRREYRSSSLRFIQFIPSRQLSDQNFNGPILCGLFRRLPNLDLVRAFDIGLAMATDPVLLKWAASEGRILLSHDIKTLPPFAYDRVRRDQSMPGVFLMRDIMPIGHAIGELLHVIQSTSQTDWADDVAQFHTVSRRGPAAIRGGHSDYGNCHNQNVPNGIKAIRPSPSLTSVCAALDGVSSVPGTPWDAVS